MKKIGWLSILAIAGVAMALAAGCGGEEEAAPPAAEPPAAEPAPPGEEPAPPAEEPAPPAEEGPTPQPGGTYRVDVETSFDFTADFDPTAEYTAIAWSFYNLLVRKLVSYRQTAGAPGGEVLPDLAVDLPEISADGLTYTFTLKDGIMFGPPLNREITSADFKFAFDRLANPNVGAFGYPLYYEVIEGFTDVAEGNADSVSGITTPDDKTVVFKLTQPAGDFPYRVAMAAAGPVPEEVAGCFMDEPAYGRYLVSSGPYMIEGSDALDATSCDTLQPIAGYDPEAHLLLVRNPSYDPATDTPEMRENFPDRFEFRINSNNDDCFDKTQAGQIEDNICSETGRIIKEYLDDPELADNLKAFNEDGIWYLSMNLALPPFDDVHVRKAVNFAMNKTAMRAAWGGPTIGDIATHVLPPNLAPPDLEGYDPYPSPDFSGDVEAAKAEMAQSKYDTDGDGLCDAPECSVVNVAGTTERDNLLVPILTEGMAAIGIELEHRQLDNPYEFIFTPSEKVQFTSTAGWGKDYPDAFTYYLYLFDGRTITPEFSYNEPLVGLTAEQAQEIGIEYPEGGVPSVDADIDACIAIADPDERLSCWGALDRKITEEIVPWVPWLWRNYSNTISDAVTQWDFDQSTGMQAWAHVAVDPALQQ